MHRPIQRSGSAAYLLFLAALLSTGCVGASSSTTLNVATGPTTGQNAETEGAAGDKANPTDRPEEPTEAESGPKAKSPQPTGSVAAGMAPPNRWPVFRGNSLGTGVSAGTLPDKLDVLWKVELGEGGFDGAAAIDSGVVFIADLYGVLYALSLETGDTIWTFTAGEVSGFVASPAVKDGRVYIGDIDGLVYCLDAKSGNKLWEFATNAEVDSCANFYKGNILIGSQDATLYCIDAETGEEVWQHQIEDQIRCTPTIVENFCFVGGCDGRLHVIDIDKGEAVRSVELGAQTGVTPAVEGDYAYLGTEGGVFIGVHWREGEVAWMHEDEKMVQPIRSSPAVMDNLVFYGGRDKRLHAINAESGEEAWSFAAKGGVDGSPVVVGDWVFFGAEDGRLYRVNRKTGQSDWNRQMRGKVKAASPAVADGRLVIGTDAAWVYCFGEKK